jgi:hypothetical protein
MASEQIINDIYKQIDVLARRIERLQNNAAPTVPIYDPTNFPQDALEGQIALGTDDNAWKFWNGVWKQIGAIPDHIVFFNKNQVAAPAQVDGNLSMLLLGADDNGFGVAIESQGGPFSFVNNPGGVINAQYSDWGITTLGGYGVLRGNCIYTSITIGPDTIAASGFQLEGVIGGFAGQIIRIAGTGKSNIHTRVIGLRQTQEILANFGLVVTL